MCTPLERACFFLKSEEGPTTVEYAVLLALIVGVAIAAIAALGDKVAAVFEGFTGALAVAGF